MGPGSQQHNDELIRGLEKNSTLTELHWENNALDKLLSFPFSCMLAKNTTLKILNISKNYMEIQGLEYICESLRFNSTLSSLDVRCTTSSMGVIPQKSTMRNEYFKKQIDLGEKIILSLSVNTILSYLKYHGLYHTNVQKREIEACLYLNRQFNSPIASKGAIRFKHSVLLNPNVRWYDYKYNNCSEKIVHPSLFYTYWMLKLLFPKDICFIILFFYCIDFKEITHWK